MKSSTVTRGLWIFASVLLFVPGSFTVTANAGDYFSQAQTCEDKDRTCGNLLQDSERKLVQRDPVEVGHVSNLTLNDGETHKLITRSLRPILFEIPNFLSSYECDHIIHLAEQEGLFESITLPSRHVEDESTVSSNNDTTEENCKELQEFDKDSDGLISLTELITFMEEFNGMALSKEDAVSLLKDTELDKNHDESISLTECLQSDHDRIDKYLLKLEGENRRYRTRFSQQAWLTVTGSDDPILKELQRRIIRLTQLPEKVIRDGEALQVVRYTVHGHYHAHYDTTEDQGAPADDRQHPPTCCRGGASANCHLCRFLTILYYLNDVPLGGETAFPVADDETLNKTKREELSNLSLRCQDANVIVKPRKGTAVMWYNHAINTNTGHLGPIDAYSLHGGCDVLQGVKWIANNWITSTFE